MCFEIHHPIEGDVDVRVYLKSKSEKIYVAENSRVISKINPGRVTLDLHEVLAYKAIEIDVHVASISRRSNFDGLEFRTVDEVRKQVFFDEKPVDTPFLKAIKDWEA
jgi:hypothetical protein